MGELGWRSALQVVGQQDGCLMGPVPVQDPLLASQEGTLTGVCLSCCFCTSACGPTALGCSGQGFSAERFSAQIHGAQQRASQGMRCDPRVCGCVWCDPSESQIHR